MFVSFKIGKITKNFAEISITPTQLLSPNIPHVRKLSKKLKVLNGFRKTNKKKVEIIKSLNTLLLLANVNYCSHCLLFFFNKNYLDLHMTTAETSGKHCLYLSESRAVVEIDKVVECSRRYVYGN